MLKRVLQTILAASVSLVADSALAGSRANANTFRCRFNSGTLKALASILLLLSGTSAYADDSLDAGFKNPPPAAKARTWWHWINGNITREGITADLEAMKAVGIQEVQLFNVSLNDPLGPAEYLSPQWLELFEFSASEAKRLGLELGFHNGPGWSSSGGPWMTPEHSMQTVVYSEVIHEGGKPFKAKLPKPDIRLDYYRDIAVLAFPKPKIDRRIDGLDYKSLSDRIRNHLEPDAKEIPAAAIIKKSDIIDLTAKLGSDGSIEWDAPAGEWIILRLGHTAKGQRNRPAPVGGAGLECDKMSKEAVDVFWAGGIAPILKQLGRHVGSVVNNCIIDSYEVGSTNWTPGFDKEFNRLRGYTCTSYLPTLAGYYVDSGEISERFLWDFRRTIGDLIAENYYAHFRKRCHEHGMKLSVEPYWGPFDNMQVGAAGDVVMCEFWSGEIAFFDSPKFVSSIAKLNDQSIVGAEAFTGLGGWVEHPATIKSIGDRAWAQGINRFIFHSYVHQPWDVAPGLTLSYHGLEFNRLNTWWNQSTAFLDYVARGQSLLQKGQTVADVLVFAGEASPNTARQIPAIKAMGYDYDLIGANKLQSLSVDGGSIRTQAGATYRALVLPKTRWMKPETIQKLNALANSGATILGPRPEKSPSLEGYPDCDKTVSSLADKLWTDELIKDQSIVDFLREASLPPDFKAENGSGKELEFIHRRTDEADIYFIANHRKEERRERCRFRVTGKQPELWNAETGEIADAGEWKSNDDGTTTVSVQLPPDGSVFVVFQKTVSNTDHVVASSTELQPRKLQQQPNLEIINAEYGTFLPDGLVDVTKVLADRVKDNQLQAKASRGLFNCDPAPGYKKEVRIRYKIGETVHETSVMEQEDITLRSGAEGDLKILGAVFGKFDENVVGVPSAGRSTNITQKIAGLVADGNVVIPVDDQLATASSEPSQNNQLRIEYSINGKLEKQKVSYGRRLNLGQRFPRPRLVAKNGETTWVTPRAGTLTCQTASGAKKVILVDSVPSPVQPAGSWKLTFPSPQGASTDATFDELNSWTESSDSVIKHFSGTATYLNHFDLPDSLVQPNVSLELDLGHVSVIAEVIVNGENLGILWKAPFRTKLDGFVHEGVNELQVKVTNLWANRLIGDETLPKDFQRKGRTIKEWPKWLLQRSNRPSERVTFAAYQHWKQDSKLQSSGLLGPVIVRPYVRTKVIGSER